MTDHIFTLHVSDEQRLQIEKQSREAGYVRVEDYLLALIEADNDDFMDDAEEAAIDLKAQFRQAWHEAMTDDTLPAREALDELFEELQRDADQD